MKRSKIFLGVTTGVLAVVAFTAAKVAKFTAVEPGYYRLNGPSCTLAGSASGFTQPAGSQFALTNGSSIPLYSYNAGACKTPLFTSNSGTN